MNVLVALIGVILMQVAATLMEVTPALAILDTQAMDFLAHVSSAIYYRCTVSRFFILRMVSLKTEVATKTVYSTTLLTIKMYF